MTRNIGATTNNNNQPMNSESSHKSQQPQEPTNRNKSTINQKRKSLCEIMMINNKTLFASSQQWLTFCCFHHLCCCCCCYFCCLYFFSNNEIELSTLKLRTILRKIDLAEGHHGNRLMTGFLSQPTAPHQPTVPRDIPPAPLKNKVPSRTFPRLPKLFQYVVQSVRNR